MDVRGTWKGGRQTALEGTSRLATAAQAPQWVGLLLSFALGMILATVRVGNAPAPFGLALLATMGYGTGGALCLLGNLAGYFAAFGITAGTQMSAGCVLVFTTAYFLRNHWLVQSKWYPPALSMCAYALTRLTIYALTGGITLYVVSRMALYLLLCGGAAYAFGDVLDTEDPRTVNSEICRNVSIVLLLACILMGVSNLVLFGSISVGRILSIVILLMLCATGGPLNGAAAGTILGVAMDVAAGSGAYLVAAYALAGLTAGLFCKHRRVLFLIVFAAVHALTVLCLPSNELRAASMIEVLGASGVYLMLPQRFVVTVGSFIQPLRAGRGESGLRHYVAERVGGMSYAYRELFEVAHGAAVSEENDADIAKVFDRAADRVCVHCALRQDCWTRSASDTLSVLNDASRKMQARGRLQTTDFPPYFRDHCLYLHEFTEVVNGELRLRAYRMRMHKLMQENRNLLWEQYRDFADVLADSSRALDSSYGADPLAERRLIRYLRSLGVEADAAVFRDHRGRLRVAIESKYLKPLLDEPDYLDGLSTVLGVRLCMPEQQATENSLVLLEAEPLAASVGIAAVRKKGETVSGDRGTYFKTDSGELCVILSDGMGTGEAAADGSIGTIGILEKFLRSGVDPSVAMKLLNSAMLLRDGENWGYATVDLMCIDLFSGEASFYKYGAAPSYVKSGGAIKKIRNISFAAGLKYEAGKTPDVMRMHLKPGSVAVIASDGVVSDGKDLWLRNLLEQADDADMKELASKVVQSAVREYGRNDDMTALAIKVEVRT